jgi:hypothetical protein
VTPEERERYILRAMAAEQAELLGSLFAVVTDDDGGGDSGSHG